MSITLPRTLTDPAYDAAVLEALARGQLDVSWRPVTASWQGHTGTILVLADAIKASNVSYVGIDGTPKQVLSTRLCASARLAQQVADGLGAMLPTPLISDLIWQQRAVTVQPILMSATEQDLAVMMTVERMILHSQKTDDQVEGASGIVGDPGKMWVIDNDLASHAKTTAENYGYHFDGATYAGSSWEPAVTSGLRVIQGRGWAHNLAHDDYSQKLCGLVHRQCLIDDLPRLLETALQDATLAGLFSHQGAMTVLRQPGVDVYKLSFASRLPTGTGVVTGALVGGAIGGPAGAAAGAGAGLVFDWWRGRRV